MDLEEFLYSENEKPLDRIAKGCIIKFNTSIFSPSEKRFSVDFRCKDKLLFLINATTYYVFCLFLSFLT